MKSTLVIILGIALIICSIMFSLPTGIPVILGILMVSLGVMAKIDNYNKKLNS